ncbi:MAG: hypothetical protein AB1626_06010 [Candidatus Micrarchaeota archaeon]
MDVKLIVRQMKAKGLTEDEIKKNLAALGVPNPDEVYAQAVERVSEMPLAPPKEEKAPAEEKIVEEAPPLEITSISGEEEKMFEVGKKPGSALPPEAAELMAPLPKTVSADVSAKLDETIALLKALQDINKKILETNREMLMRLKMK